MTRKNKTKNKSIIITLLVLFIVTLFSIQTNIVSAADYTLLEKIPGIDSKDGVTMAQYAEALYNFAVAAVVISALMMITIGGFMYITSAGNQAQATTAKKVITDALLGLVIVFTIWITLHTINPVLVDNNMDLGSMKTELTQQVFCVEGGTCYKSKDDCEQNKLTPNSTCTDIEERFDEKAYYFCTVGCNCTQFNTLKECVNSNQNQFDDSTDALGCISGSKAKSSC